MSLNPITPIVSGEQRIIRSYRSLKRSTILTGFFSVGIVLGEFNIRNSHVGTLRLIRTIISVGTRAMRVTLAIQRRLDLGYDVSVIHGLGIRGFLG